MTKELRGSTVVVRPVAPGDAPGLLNLYLANREFFEPWWPERPPDFYTLERQRDLIEREIAERRLGVREVFTIRNLDGDVVGRMALNDLIRGVFQSGHLGYDVGREHNGRGYATEAVRLVVGYGFRELGLHRVQAATMIENARSQRVLEKAGFRREGVALRYLRIAGAWQDHVIFAVTVEEWPPEERG
jgi:ribosomal-protein-alanine N-acetyltransferase